MVTPNTQIHEFDILLFSHFTVVVYRDMIYEYQQVESCPYCTKMKKQK